jgi:hypothetical protein
MATVTQSSSALREKPIGEIAGDLTRDLSLLVRQEIALARAEITEKGKTAAPALGMIGGAGLLGLMAAGAGTACAVMVLAIFLPAWLSALVVAAAFAGVAYLLAKHGKAQLEDVGAPIPTQTIETIKEDLEWAKTRATSARK